MEKRKSSEISQEDYNGYFGINEGAYPSKVQKTLEYAIQNRKFEIELYWTRTTYFWTLIGIVFTGYCVIMSAEKINDFYAFVLACVGLVFTIAWYFVNKGSKHWQENWENHVDLLEDMVIGPLHKINLCRPKEDRSLSRRFLGPCSPKIKS